MVKDGSGIYEPNRRRWIKLKRDHLGTGMADTVDLVVLGSYYGRGRYGKMQSVWLCGVFDDKHGRWCTVAKVGNGMSDLDTQRFNQDYDMVRVDKPADIPKWLHVTSAVRPDFVVKDPWKVRCQHAASAFVH